jgi:hypothetical protein
MVETYGTDEERFYFIDEAVFGETPASPAMLSVPCDSINPQLDTKNILLRGSGSYDLQAIKRGLRAPELKISYIMPSEAPIALLQLARTDLNKSLSCQIIYFKGIFAEATDILSLLYTGMRIGKVSVSCEIEDVLRASVDLLGQNLTTSTAKIANATYGDHSGAVAFHETYLKKSTVEVDRVVGWRFDVNNNPKRVPVIRSTNGHLAKFVPFGHRQLGGEVTFEFESKAEMDEALADSEFDLEFGLGGEHKAAFPACKWSNVTHQRWLDDLISVRAQFDSKGPLSIT